MGELPTCVTGLNGYCELSKDSILVHRKKIAYGPAAREQEIPLSQLVSVGFQPASTYDDGHIEFIYKETDSETGKISLLFTGEQQRQFQVMKAAVLQRLRTMEQTQGPATQDGAAQEPGSAVQAHCSMCGAEIVTGATFCHACGNPVSETVEIEATEGLAGDTPYYRYIAMSGGALVVIGSLLPWIKMQSALGTLSRTGLDEGDGIWTLVLGGLVVLSGLVGMRESGGRAIFAVVFSVLVLIIGFVDLADVGDRISAVESEYVIGSVGEGLYLVIVGGILGLAGVFPNGAPIEKRLT